MGNTPKENSMVTLITTGLAALPSILSGINSMVQWVQNLRAAAKQSGEWDETQEQAYQAWVLRLNDSEHWKTDAELAAENQPPPGS